MGATVVLVLFLTFVFGGMLLALVMGYQGIEQSRAPKRLARESDAAMTGVVASPAFFASVGERQSQFPTAAFDDALLAALEKHVRAEQAIVTQFVHFPSVDSLYSRSSSLHVH